MTSFIYSSLGIPPRLVQELKGLSTSTLLTLVSLPSPTASWLLTMANIAVDKIGPNDKRIEHNHVEVNGHRWHYVDAKPKGPQRGTVFLIHGWPDIWLAWRYQVPLLLSLGLRCIIPDCMGYGGSDAPSDLRAYSYKAHADAFAGIAKHIGVDKIILGGHDWGGMVVYRVAQWYPDLVTHVFAVATPYLEVQDRFVTTEELVAGPLPQFGYQLQLGSKDQVVEKAIHGKPAIRSFLNAAYGGQVPSKAKVFAPETGFNLDSITNEKVTMSPLLSEEELDYYVDHFSIHGMNGPCNWYRTREINHEEEQKITMPHKKTLQQPILFIACAKDNVLLPEMSVNMEKSIPHLSRATVPASHWALWHTPAETNAEIKKWFEGVVFGGKHKL